MAYVLAILFILILEGYCSDEYRSRCVLFAGTCVEHCPRNMHAYHTRCDRDTLSQRTCDEPFKYVLGFTCGWSRCDCNGELLLDERSHTCVDYDTCLLEHKGKIKNKRKQGLFKKSKKIKLPKEDEEFPYKNE